MSEPTSCCRVRGSYCERCGLLVGLPGLRVSGVERGEGGPLVVYVESEPAVRGCPTCGVVAHGHGRVGVRLVDAPSFGRPTRVVWRKRRWVCTDPGCPVATFVEQDARVWAPRARLTARACDWAIEQLRREHASVNGIRRQLGVGWRTVWEAIEPLLKAADADASRFDGVTILLTAGRCAGHGDGAAGRPPQVRHRVQETRLASTVAPQQPYDRSAGDGERDAGQHRRALEDQAQAGPPAPASAAGPDRSRPAQQDDVDQALVPAVEPQRLLDAHVQHHGRVRSLPTEALARVLVCLEHQELTTTVPPVERVIARLDTLLRRCGGSRRSGPPC